MPSTIALEGMRFFAYHGFYEEERKIGNEFVVDVTIQTDVDSAAATDDLYKTINYETIYQICEANMRRPSKLLENVVQRIALDIKHQFGTIREMSVSIRKLNPPLGGRVDAARVEVDGDFRKKCGRCGRPMLCYNDRTCWCIDTDDIKRANLEGLKIKYGNQCLCRECLQFFAG
jgi:dihydroneopterin aldolase